MQCNLCLCRIAAGKVSDETILVVVSSREKSLSLLLRSVSVGSN